jgi:hypothetical protein
MIPAKGGLVDLGKGKTTTLVGVLDMSKIIVEVMEGIVASFSQVGGDDGLRSHGEGNLDKLEKSTDLTGPKDSNRLDKLKQTRQKLKQTRRTRLKNIQIEKSMLRAVEGYRRRVGTEEEREKRERQAKEVKKTLYRRRVICSPETAGEVHFFFPYPQRSSLVGESTVSRADPALKLTDTNQAHANPVLGYTSY